MLRLRHRLRRLKRRVAAIAYRRRPESKLKELLALSWPIAAAMAGETVMGLVDTKLVGGLGAAALGGVGVGFAFMYLGYIVVIGLLRGVKIRTAYAVGEGRTADAIRYAQAGLVLGVGAAVAIWAAARDLSGVMTAVGIDQALVPYARDFVAAATWGAPGACVVQALTQHRQGLGDARTPMVINLAGNVLNAALGWTLIYGHFGAPALGVRGGGFATAIVESLEATAFLVVLVRDARRARGQRVGIRLPTAIKEVFTLGGPTGLQMGFEMLAFTTFTALLGSIGAEQLAAHQASIAIIRTSFLPGIAVGEAASVLVGQSLGRRDLRAADGVTRAALGVAIAFMAACGVIFAVFDGPIARALTPDAATAGIAKTLLLIAAVFQVLDAVNIVLRGALRGAKDVTVPALLGIGIIWTCVPGAALLLGKNAGMGAVGGWCGFIGETVLSSLLFGLRWRFGTWRRPFSTTAGASDPPLAAEVAAE